MPALIRLIEPVRYVRGLRLFIGLFVHTRCADESSRVSARYVFYVLRNQNFLVALA